MIRPLFLIFCLFAFNACSAQGQEWAEKMFKVKSHDFETVAQGAKAEYVFEFENSYEEDLHVASVRTNCGCTTPFVETETVKTWETGRIRARFNTGSFIGDRKATITVVFDRPFPAEVQLQVKGSIRSDISFQPGAVDFGTVDQGNAKNLTVQVTHYNDPNWKIEDVLCLNTNYAVSLKQLERNPQKVSYELKVEIAGDYPVGAIRDELIIVSNNKQHPKVNLAMQGEVLAPLSISPMSIDFGEVEAGQPVTKKIFVRASSNLEITDVKCPKNCLQVQSRKVNENVSMISLTLNADAAELDSLPEKIEIEANIGRQVKVAVPVSARLK